MQDIKSEYLKFNLKPTDFLDPSSFVCDQQTLARRQIVSLKFMRRLKFNPDAAATFTHGKTGLNVPVFDVQSLGSMNSSVCAKGNK